ncbi:unnamed protein product [Linum trigynum]|uniref:Uncharacterized protein n=1 Tax=Linum trigynum TaxID=586398 RepID=A0AAV2G3Y5_9ROSI
MGIVRRRPITPNYRTSDYSVVDRAEIGMLAELNKREEVGDRLDLAHGEPRKIHSLSPKNHETADYVRESTTTSIPTTTVDRKEGRCAHQQ